LHFAKLCALCCLAYSDGVDVAADSVEEIGAWVELAESSDVVGAFVAASEEEVGAWVVLEESSIVVGAFVAASEEEVGAWVVLAESSDVVGAFVVASEEEVGAWVELVGPSVVEPSVTCVVDVGDWVGAAVVVDMLEGA